jgi:hypothetical protein
MAPWFFSGPVPVCLLAPRRRDLATTVAIILGEEIGAFLPFVQVTKPGMVRECLVTTLWGCGNAAKEVSK